jgi:xanthine dehydrogenase accessory factor
MSDEGLIWRRLAEWSAAGVPCALATVVRTAGSAPREAGAKLLLRADGTSLGTVGGGALELAVTQVAVEVLAEGTTRLLSYQLKADLGMACGGSADVFVESIKPVDRLYIFGAGHIGAALCPITAALGFHVTMIDDRGELATVERFPQAAAVVHSFDVAVWGELAFDDRTYCVVVSPSHAIDAAVVQALLPRPCRYVGMIASLRKRKAVEAALLEAGIAAARIAELRAPIGLSIGAETPQEIAVSIAAELVQIRRHAGPAAQSDT